MDFAVIVGVASRSVLLYVRTRGPARQAKGSDRERSVAPPSGGVKERNKLRFIPIQEARSVTGPQISPAAEGT